jgi:uncharacterized delta-60 repeat protein
MTIIIQKFILTVMLVTLITGSSGSGDLIWVKSAGAESQYTAVLGITTLSDSSTVMIGNFYGPITFGQGELNQIILIPVGSDNFFIARHNPDGTLAWAKRVGGTELTDGVDGCGITTLSDDSTVVTGKFGGTVTFGQSEPNQTVLTSAGSSDIFIARYNPDGTLSWVKSSGGEGYDDSLEVTSLSGCSAVIVGYFHGSATFGPGEPNQTILTSAGFDDIFLACYNPDGTLAWAKRAGGAFGDYGYGITTLSDNSTVVTGIFGDSATFGPGELNQTTLSSDGFFDIFIARYNPDGVLAWAKRAGGASYEDCGTGITALSDNSTVVTGQFDESATFGPGEPNQTVLTSVGEYDIFIARYNTDGTLAWAKHAGGTSYEEGNGITALADNSTIVTGWFNRSATFGLGEPNQTVLTSAGLNDVFIARYNPDGMLVWAKSMGSATGVDRGREIISLPDNSVVVAGYFSGSATFGLGEPNETVLASIGTSDIFFARFNP